MFAVALRARAEPSTRLLALVPALVPNISAAALASRTVTILLLRKKPTALVYAKSTRLRAHKWEWSSFQVRGAVFAILQRRQQHQTRCREANLDWISCYGLTGMAM